MISTKAPAAWSWSHDLDADDLDGVLVPGVRLVRLSSYRVGAHLRFATLTYEDAGPARRYVLALDAADAAKLLHETDDRPVAITVDPGSDPPRFSLVLESGPGPVAGLHVGLDEAGLRALVDDHHGVADLVTYTTSGARTFAAIVAHRTAPSWLFTGVTAPELDARLAELGAAPVRLRSYVDAGRPLFAALAERTARGPRSWFSGLDADAVNRTLDQNQSYPLDLDATRHDQGLRFDLIVARDD